MSVTSNLRKIFQDKTSRRSSRTSIFDHKHSQHSTTSSESIQLIVVEIRDDLIERVLEECYQKYLKKQCVKFTAHCAHLALIQIVNLGLFHHDPGRPFYVGHRDWSEDKPPKASPPDTWAAGQIPPKPKALPAPILEEPVKIIQERELSNVFTPIKIEKVQEEGEARSTSNIEVLFQDKYLKFGNTEWSVCPPTTEVFSSDEEEPKEEIPKRALSIFTKTSQMTPEEYSRHIYQSPSQTTGFGKKPLGLSLSEEKLSAKAKLSVCTLPPLR